MSEQDFSAIERLIAAIRPYVKRWNDLTHVEKLGRVAEGRRAVASEIQSAYDEQRSNGTRYFLTREDVVTLNRLATYAEWDYAIAVWRQAPEHDAAEKMLELVPDDAKAKQILATRPRLVGIDENGVWRGYDEPPYPRPHSLPNDCPPLIAVDQPVCWDEVVGKFLRARRRAVLQVRGTAPQKEGV